MDVLKYAFHSQRMLMKELKDVVYEMRRNGPDVEIPSNFHNIMLEVENRLHRLESLED